MKHIFLKHPAILSTTKLICATGFAAALFGTSVPSAPVPNDNGRFLIITGAESSQQDGTEETGDGQGISPQNDEEYANCPQT